MATSYTRSPNLQNFMNHLDSIKNTGNFDVAMKLPPPPKPVPPTAENALEGGMGGSALGPGMRRSPGGSVSVDARSSLLERLRRAIRQQESGGNYGARNSMYGASGAYQILPSNFTQTGSGWDMEALGHDVTLQQFMNSPQIQDRIATYKLAQYLREFGSPEAAAAAWYGGPGSVSHMYDKSTQAGGYPSIYAYWKSVLAKM